MFRLEKHLPTPAASRPAPADPDRPRGDELTMGAVEWMQRKTLVRWWHHRVGRGWARAPRRTCRLADAFAGALGFSQSFEQAGAAHGVRVDTRVSYEACPTACRVQRANQRHPLHRVRHYTIGAQTEKAIGHELESLAIDIVLIAPPCTIWHMSSD